MQDCGGLLDTCQAPSQLLFRGMRREEALGPLALRGSHSANQPLPGEVAGGGESGHSQGEYTLEA